MDGKKMLTWMRKFLLLLILLPIAACTKTELATPYHSIDVGWQHPHADFHLADFNGNARRLGDFRGKVVVLFFGYTHCPDICPTTLADLAQVMRVLGKDAERVQVLFVTLDPERDTRELLAKYVPAFHPAFLGLYGDAQATSQAAGSFGVNYQKQEGPNGYTLDHSTGIYLIGAYGKPLLLAPYDQRIEQLAEDIKFLLRIAH
jgi:protein SCO1